MTTATLRPNGNISGSMYPTIADQNSGTYVTIVDGNRVSMETFTLPAAAIIHQVEIRALGSHPYDDMYYRYRIHGGPNVDPWESYEQNLGNGALAWRTDYLFNYGWTQGHIDNFNVEFFNSNGPYLHELEVVFHYALKPVATVTGPSGESSTTPYITWTHTGDFTQAYWRVKVFSAAQYGAGGFNPETSTPTYDSTEGSGTATAKQCTTTLTPGTTYKAYVKTAQVVNSQIQWSDWDDGATFIPPGNPSVVVTGPSGSVTTAKPQVGWNYTWGAGASSGQSKFQVKVFSAAQYGIGGFDPASSPNTYDSGAISGAGTTHTLTSNLANGTTYKAYVRAAQTIFGADQWSAWDDGSTFTIAVTVPTPTSVSPTHTSTVTTSRPAVSATVAAMADGITLIRRWQFATDSGFTTGVVTIDETSYANSKSGSFAFPALPTRLAQGTWYLRCRSVDQYGQTSAWTSTNTITVAHQPTTTGRTPGGSQTLLYGATVPFAWLFSDIDTDDFQLKYQVQMWRTNDAGIVVDSGLTTSGNLAHSLAVPGVTWKDNEIRWRMLVHDQDNVASAWSPEQTFLLSDNPVVTIASPANSAVITTSQPTITWSHTASLGRTQAQYKVDIYNTTENPDLLVASSGWLSGTATSWTPGAPAVEVGPNYSVTVTIIDSVGLSGSDTNTFTASYPAIASPTVSLDNSAYPAEAKVALDWSGSSVDANFYAWRVYRRPAGTTPWTLLAEYGAPATVTHDDYTCPSQVEMEYAIVQVAIVFSAQVESAYIPLTSQATLLNYMLTCQVDPSLNVALYHVTSDSFEEEQEQATMNLIGRGRRFEYGTEYGVTGSLTASLRDQYGGLTARAQRLAINALRESNNPIFLLNPFGDVYSVGLSSLSVQREAGTGLHEAATVTIGYTEVGAT